MDDAAATARYDQEKKEAEVKVNEMLRHTINLLCIFEVVGAAGHPQQFVEMNALHELLCNTDREELLSLIAEFTSRLARQLIEPYGSAQAFSKALSEGKVRGYTTNPSVLERAIFGDLPTMPGPDS